MAVGFLGGNFEGNDGILVPLDFKNSICFGQTGSGKTTGYILPNIQSRLSAGHSVVIFDYKGNLHAHVKKLAKECGRLGDVVEIGPIWGHRFNLLCNIAIKDIEQWYRSLFTKKYDYWEIASCSLFKTLYAVQRFLYESHGILEKIHSYYDYIEPLDKERPAYPTFAWIGETLNVASMRALMEKLHVIHKYLFLSLEVEELHNEDKNALLCLIEESERFSAFLSRYAKLKEEDSGDESGNHGVMSCLLNTIQDGIECDVVNGEGFDLPELIEQKKIIIIYADTLGQSIARLLNQRIFAFLARRTIFLKEIQPVSIFIDEAHRVLAPGCLPEVSLCRENCFEYLMSVQDRILLENALGEHDVEEMMVNVAHQISFKNDSISTCNTLEPFYYRNLVQNARFGKARPIFFDKHELVAVVREYQQLFCVFERFTDTPQNGGYLVHDVDKSNDSIAIFVDADDVARELRVYDKHKLYEKWQSKTSRRTNHESLDPSADSRPKLQAPQAHQPQDTIDDFSQTINKKLEEFRVQILQIQDRDKQIQDELERIYALLKRLLP